MEGGKDWLKIELPAAAMRENQTSIVTALSVRLKILSKSICSSHKIPLLNYFQKLWIMSPALYQQAIPAGFIHRTKPKQKASNQSSVSQPRIRQTLSEICINHRNLTFTK